MDSGKRVYMILYECDIEVNGEPEQHDIELTSGWTPERIPELFRICFDGEVVVKNYRQFQWETCDRCNGGGVVPPCCKGNVSNIECACHGEEKACGCDGGQYKKYL